MKKNVLKSKITKIVSVFFLVISAVNCSNDSNNNDEPTPAGRFKSSDFKVTKYETDQLHNDFYFKYEITNSKNIDYNYDIDGDFSIKVKFKTTDGTSYQDQRLLPSNIGAGTTISEQLVFEISEERTADLNTITYEIFAD